MALPVPDQTLDHRLMDVLVLETEPGSADWTTDELTDRGHRVSRCHEPGRPAFPCRALEGQGPCPLSDPGIDVAVTVRAHPGTRPSPREDGVACALRARVPVVVAGRVARHGAVPDRPAASTRSSGAVVTGCRYGWKGSLSSSVRSAGWSSRTSRRRCAPSMPALPGSTSRSRRRSTVMATTRRLFVTSSHDVQPCSKSPPEGTV